MNATQDAIDRADAGFVEEDKRDRQIRELKYRIDSLVDAINNYELKVADFQEVMQRTNEEKEHALETINHQKVTMDLQSETIAILKERVEVITSTDLLQTISKEVRRIVDDEYFGGAKDDETHTTGGAE